MEYLGSIEATSGASVTTASVLGTFPTATILKMKTSGVQVAIDGYAKFTVDYNEETALVTGHTYIFDKDCIVAVGK